MVRPLGHWDDRRVLPFGNLVLPALQLVPFVLLFLAIRTAAVRLATAIALVAFDVVVLHMAFSDEDPTAAGFGLLLVPIYGALAVVVIGVVDRAVAARRRATGPATFGDRLLAFVVDLVVGLGWAWFLAERVEDTVALTAALAGAAAVMAVGVATGGTVGHRLLGLRVVDARTGGRLSVTRATGRALLVVATVAVAVLLPPLVPVLLVHLAWATEANGATFIDLLVGSQVVAVGATSATAPEVVAEPG